MVGYWTGRKEKKLCLSALKKPRGKNKGQTGPEKYDYFPGKVLR